VDRGVTRGQRGGSPTVVNLSFLDRSRYFSLNSSSFILTGVEWTPSQSHCYSENLSSMYELCEIKNDTQQLYCARFPVIGEQNDDGGILIYLIKILDNIHLPVFYLKRTFYNVRTSQETHYVSATDSSQLMLCRM
jgi:hypothetical protein